MNFGHGTAACSNSRDAGRRAARDAVKTAGRPAIVMVFTTDCLDHEAVLAGVRSVTGDAPLVGCCAGGVISGTDVLRDGVGVCAISGPDLTAVTALEPGLHAGPRQAGEQLGRRLRPSGQPPGSVFLFPDGLSPNISQTLRGVYDVLGPDYAYAGGGTGDNLKFQKTYQFAGAEVQSDAVAAALVRGIPFGMAIGHGWKPLGDPFLVSRAENKRVQEIDGLPAFAAYRQRLGDIPLEAFPDYGMRHPLGFPDVAGNYLIRDPIAVNDDHSIEFVTEVPRNAFGYLMQSDIDELIAMSGTIARQAAAQVCRPQFALCFDCISRYLLMKEDFYRELVAVREALGPAVPLFGALTFGEIGSYVDVPMFHNKTMVIAVGGEQ